MPEGHDADRLREFILENFDMSLGTGLAKLAGKVFRIGHLGHFNDLMLAGTLSGVEMGLRLAGIPHRPGGVTAALNSLAQLLRKNREEERTYALGPANQAYGAGHSSLFLLRVDALALSHLAPLFFQEHL
jgi:hypothetical protein